MPPEPAVSAEGVSRRFPSGAQPVNAVDDVTIEVARGEIIALVGPSGCGKTTLLHLLGGLDTPTSGSVHIEGVDWASLGRTDLAIMRRRQCGFVFQSLALLPMATAFENVETPLLLDSRPRSERVEAVAEMLDRVGLPHKADAYPDQLSGGEQQRVAIARALVHSPALVLADEPTGSLDSHTAQEIAQLLTDSARSRDAAVVLVTHDERIARYADRIIRLDSGRIEGSGPNPLLESRR
jgi:putative ABC transport system ATP-binding protein